MKKLLLPIIILFLNITPANALNIAVIETAQIVEKSTAMKRAKEQIIKQQEIYKKELSKEEEDLKVKLDKFKTKRAKFTEEAAMKKEKDLQGEIQELNTLLQRRNKSLQEAEMEIMNKIGKKIEEILEDIKIKNNYDLILSSDQIILYNDNMDISDEVLKRLNKELPKVKVRF